MLLGGQVAVVTGAGRGIGRAIARRFAAEGAAVLVTARTAEEVDGVAAEIRQTGGRSEGVTADVSREQDCERIVRTARARFGAIHILVNNAGIYGPVKEAQEVSPIEWDQVQAINLRGPFLLSRLVLPEMYQRGSGVLLNISSVSGKTSHPFGAPYMASKAGLLGLTRALAAEGARRGVRVNAICPGPVKDTGMARQLGPLFGEKLGVSSEQQWEDLMRRILQGRGQTPEEIAAAAVFLASDQAAAITGQAFNVDGGMAFY
jgi:NAD(P)-dependent dehydrogenase (short-subunit alcohol dehydrogenase family)